MYNSFTRLTPRYISINIIYTILRYYIRDDTISSLGYERVYLPLYEVADTPFHIHGDDVNLRDEKSDGNLLKIDGLVAFFYCWNLVWGDNEKPGCVGIKSA